MESQHKPRHKVLVHTHAYDCNEGGGVFGERFAFSGVVSAVVLQGVWHLSHDDDDDEEFDSNHTDSHQKLLVCHPPPHRPNFINLASCF